MLNDFTLFLKIRAEIHKREKSAKSRLMFSTTGVFFVALRRDLRDFSVTSFQGNWYQVHCADRGNKLKAEVTTF